jgi:hypothetical protein
LYFYGQPDNRYSFIGYTRRGSDIIKFDQLVHAVRRLCQPLEAHFLGERFKDRSDIPNLTKREWLLEGDPAADNLYSNLEEVVAGKRGKMLRWVLLNWSLQFAPPEFKHGRMAYGGMMVNPVLVRRFLDPLDSGKDETNRHADELWAWALDNLYLPREFIRVFEKARADRKAAAISRGENR